MKNPAGKILKKPVGKRCFETAFAAPSSESQAPPNKVSKHTPKKPAGTGAELAALREQTDQYLQKLGCEGRGLIFYAKRQRFQVDYTFDGTKGQVTQRSEGQDDHGAEIACHKKFHQRAKEYLGEA